MERRNTGDDRCKQHFLLPGLSRMIHRPARVYHRRTDRLFGICLSVNRVVCFVCVLNVCIFRNPTNSCLLLLCLWEGRGYKV